MKKYLIILLFSLTVSFLYAQQQSPDTTVLKLELKDGSSLIGNVLAEDSSNIQFRTLSGITLTLPHTQIRFKMPISTPSFVVTDTIKKQELTFDPNRTRLFLMPTARPIGSGRGYFSAGEIIFPTLAAGIGNVVSIAGGVSLIPAAQNQLLYFAPKVTLVNTNKASLALGGLYVGATGKSEGTTLLYGAGTIGNERGALTIAARIPTASDQNSIIVIGGELQTSESLKLITENWILTNSVLYSFGLRFFGEKLAADLGFIKIPDVGNDGFPFFPWLGFTYNFGQPMLQESQTVEDQIFSPPTYTIRATIDIVSGRGNKNYTNAMQQQNFAFNEYSSDIFSNNNNNNRNGNGLTVQLERTINKNFYGGLTVSTVGEVVGSSASIVMSRNNYSTNYYYSYELLSIEHTITTYGAHISYLPLVREGEHSSTNFITGAGFGLSTVDVTWKSLNYPYYNQLMKTFSSDLLTGFIFLSFEQKISQLVSLGVHGSYFLLPDVDYSSFHLYDIEYTDYSTGTARQITVPVNIAAHSINFSYGKIGISIGLHF